MKFVATLSKHISLFSLEFHFFFKSQYVKWKNDFTSLFTIILLANGYSFTQSCDKSVKLKPLEKSPARFSLLLFSRWLNLLFPSWKFKDFCCVFCTSKSAWCAKTVCICRKNKNLTGRLAKWKSKMRDWTILNPLLCNNLLNNFLIFHFFFFHRMAAFNWLQHGKWI